MPHCGSTFDSGPKLMKHVFFDVWQSLFVADVKAKRGIYAMQCTCGQTKSSRRIHVERVHFDPKSTTRLLPAILRAGIPFPFVLPLATASLTGILLGRFIQGSTLQTDHPSCEPWVVTGLLS
jgi:hypothetical protein